MGSCIRMLCVAFARVRVDTFPVPVFNESARARACVSCASGTTPAAHHHHQSGESASSCADARFTTDRTY